eukprot:273415-Amphidinium_carterae.1
MIASVQHQVNNDTARVQEAVQDNAEVIIAQRINQETSTFHNILNGNIQQRDRAHADHQVS